MTMLRYNTGKAPLSLVPTSFFEAIWNAAHEAGQAVPTKLIWHVGQVLAFGAEKYDAHNWRKGGSWMSVINSALRHLVAMMDGRRIDPESGLSEAGHLGCNLAFLLEFAHIGLGEDDRYNVPFHSGFDADPEPSLTWVFVALLRFRDGGDHSNLREAIWELARWVEVQTPPAPPVSASIPLPYGLPAANLNIPLDVASLNYKVH